MSKQQVYVMFEYSQNCSQILQTTLYYYLLMLDPVEGIGIWLIIALMCKIWKL